MSTGGPTDDSQQLAKLNAKQAELKREMERQRQEYEQQMQILTDMTKFYELVNIMANVVNGVNSIEDPTFKDAVSDMDYVHRHLNNNKLPDRYDPIVEMFAKSHMFEYFLLPHQDDTGYKQFYNTMHTIRDKSMLAHRFDFAGRDNQDGVKFNLHGGYQRSMMPQMAKSFEYFLNNHGGDLVSEMMEYDELSQLRKEKVLNLLEMVSNDVKNAILLPDDERVQKMAGQDQVMSLAPSLKTESQGVWHAINVTFFNDLCLIGDKARDDNQGIEIYKMSGDSDSISKAAIEIIRKRSVVHPDDPVTTIDMFTSELSKQLKMKKIGHIPLQAQFGENCTWSSCSKSALRAALYCRFYQAAQSLGKDPQEAQQWAQNAAQFVHKNWSRFDKIDYLRKYLEQYNDPAIQHLGPDPVLLAYVKLKYQHRQGSEEILKLIEDTGLVNEEYMKQAREMAYKRAEMMLSEEFPIIYKFFSTRINEIARRFADLYMLTNKSTIEETFNSISFVSFSPFKNAIDALDKAINEAKTTPVQKKRSKPLLAYKERMMAESAVATSSSSSSKQDHPNIEGEKKKRKTQHK